MKVAEQNNQHRGVLHISFQPKRMWIDANWRSLQILILVDTNVSVCSRYRDVSAPFCICTSVRVLILLKYISRDFMIFHCIISASCSDFFGEFECIRRNETHINSVVCTHINLKTHCTKWEPISHKRRVHSAVVVLFFISSSSPFHFIWPVTNRTYKIINTILLRESFCELLLFRSFCYRHPHYHSNYNQHTHR